MSIKNECIKRLRDLRFLAAGDPVIVKQLETLCSMILAHDFESNRQASMRERNNLLQTTVFPGPIEKPFTSVEFPPGNIMRGKVDECCVGHLKFWTTDGITEIPYHSLPEDLQSAFPSDLGVQFRAKVISKMEQIDSAYKDNAEIINNLMDFQEEQNAALSARIAQLESENRANLMRISELEADLRDRRD